MENWEDWSWQVKAYVSLFKVEALRVLEDAEIASSPITDDALERLETDTTELVDTELVKFRNTESKVRETIRISTAWQHTGCNTAK